MSVDSDSSKQEGPRSPDLDESRSTFDIMWREAMMELLDQLEAENPEDTNLAPKVTTPCSERNCLAQLDLFRVVFVSSPHALCMGRTTLTLVPPACRT